MLHELKLDKKEDRLSLIEKYHFHNFIFALMDIKHPANYSWLCLMFDYDRLIVCAWIKIIFHFLQTRWSSISI